MASQKKKKSANAAYCHKYRLKIQLKRLQSKSFDKSYKKNTTARQRLHRAKKKQQEQQQLSILSSSTDSTTTRANLRKLEGLQRRRQNTAKLKSDLENLENSNKQLQEANKKLKAQLASLTLSSSQQTTTNSTIRISPTKVILQNLSPSAKRRATERLMVQKQDLPRGTIRSIRNELGINLSNQNIPPRTTTTQARELSNVIEQFLNNDEITRLTPDTKRIINGKQVRFFLNHLCNLHQRFILETNYECSYSTFSRHIPSHFVSPKPHEWGSCLCITCLNPQIKSERINQLKNNYPMLNYLSSLITNDLSSTMNDENKVKEILQELDSLKAQTFAITSVEWIKKKNERSSGFTSTKTIMTDTMNIFCTKFNTEISNLQQHMKYARAQFKGVKLLRQSALANDNIITLQIDWSENYHLKQAREERSAYYYEQHVSIAAGYVWSKGSTFSFGCLSDETSHVSESTWTAIHELLNELLSRNTDNQITELNIISDSPSSQYRNKTTIYFLKHYAISRKIIMRWLFLEKGHGKGIADSVGASIKRSFDNVIRFNPDKSFKGAQELMNNIKDSTSIRLYLYKKEDIDSLREQIPSLTTVKGTSMFHEIIAKPNGQIFAKNKSDEPETLIKTNF